MSKQTDAREIARGYFNRIISGHKNTVSRPDLNLPGNESIDRQLRILVEEANHNGDCIINVGNGYYRPIPGTRWTNWSLRNTQVRMIPGQASSGTKYTA
ncbi:hypothetical protein LC724_08260 [Blautia sp. RD014234]|nr:hypothetical protein [Blautia parvula]